MSTSTISGKIHRRLAESLDKHGRITPEKVSAIFAECAPGKQGEVEVDEEAL